MNLAEIKPGDAVCRQLGIDGPTMDLFVSEVTDTEIVCGPWRFSRLTGAEIDDELGWGTAGTGSFLVCGVGVEEI